MEPVTAFGVAVNALQLVDFGLRLARNINEIQKTGSLAKFKDDEKIAAQLLTACKRFTSKTEAAELTKDSESQEVLEIAEECMNASEELLGELAKFKTDKGRKWRQSLAIGLRITKNNKIEEIQKKLEKHQATLNTTLLIKLDRKAREAEYHHDLESARQSFCFEDMHDWEERISETFPQTCKWVLGLEPADKDEEYEDVPIYGYYSQHKKMPEPQYRFLDWLKKSSSIYWIAGKPGSGKSCLMKYICKHPKTQELLGDRSSVKKPLVLKHFFWKSGSSIQSSLSGMLRTLLYQVLQTSPKLGLDVIGQKLIASGLPEVSKLSRWHHWSLKDMMDMINQVVAAHNQGAVLILIDGLDECIEGEQGALLDFITDIGSKNNAKLCVSSRPEKVFATRFGNARRLYLQDLNYEDIERTVLGTLLPVLRESGVGKTDGSRLQFAKTVAEKAEGIFLFARLALNDLVSGAQNGDTMQMLKDNLDLLPKDLEMLFSHLLSRVERRYQTESFKYLQWILHDLEITKKYQLEQHGLTVLHFVFMNSENKPLKKLWNSDFAYFQSEEFGQLCERTRDRIITCCAGLIETRPASGPWKALDKAVGLVGAQSLKFIHRSVSDFFHQSSVIGEEYGGSSNILHARCSSEIAFLGLAYRSYLQRCRHSNARLRLSRLQREVDNFLRRFFMLVTEFEDPASIGHKQTDPRFESFRLPQDLGMMLNGICQLDLEDNGSGSQKPVAIDVTSLLACYGLYRHLIEHAALYHVVGSKICSPVLEHVLICAVNGLLDKRLTAWQISNHLATIKMLLDLGANPNICFNIKGSTLVYTETAWTAFVKGSCLFRALTEAILNATSDSVTSQAADSFWLSVLSAFLDHGADPNAIVFKDVDYSDLDPGPPSNILLRISIVAHLENALLHHCLNTHSQLVLMQALDLLRSRGAESRKGIAYAQVVVRDPERLLTGIVYRGNMIEQPTRRLFPIPQHISDQVPDWMYADLQYQRLDMRTSVVNHIESLFDEFRQEGAKSIDDDDDTPPPHHITFDGVKTYDEGTAGHIADGDGWYKEDANDENPFRALRDRLRSGQA